MTVARLHWPKDFLPGWHHFQVSLSFEGHRFLGASLAADETRAFAIACTEAFERAATAHLPTPWATAAHPIGGEARLKATWELLTMDSAIAHCWAGKPFERISTPPPASQLPWKSLLPALRSHGLQIEFFKMQSLVEAYTAAARLTSASSDIPGFVMGFGAGMSLAAATDHAVIECLRRGIPSFLTPPAFPSDLGALEVRGDPLWHYWNCLNGSLRREFDLHLIPHEAPRHGDRHLPLAPPSPPLHKQVRIPIPMDGLPLEVWQAIPEPGSLIRPKFGCFMPDHDDLQRLSRFAGYAITSPAMRRHVYG